MVPFSSSVGFILFQLGTATPRLVALHCGGKNSVCHFPSVSISQAENLLRISRKYDLGSQLLWASLSVRDSPLPPVGLAAQTQLENQTHRISH